MPIKVFLFDLDSVLIEPNGYRAAALQTIRYFTRRAGLDDSFVPGYDIYEMFESMRVTSEWDMIPISLAILFERLKTHSPGLNLPATIMELHDLELPAGLPAIEYRQLIQPLAGYLVPGEFPSGAILRAALQSSDGATQTPELFPSLTGHPLLVELLAESRDVSLSPSTRIFQHYTLGSQTFQEVYGLQSEIETPSLIRLHDIPLLSKPLGTELLAWWDRSEHFMAAFTARPSLPPREIVDWLPGYAPEAEMALELIGFPEIPLISYGRVKYLAELQKRGPEAFLKPSPVQALSAIIAALTGQELPAMKSALAIVNHERVKPICQQPLSIHIFEDTPSGIDAARKAIELLNLTGTQAGLYAWGIARSDDKAFSLGNLGVPVFKDINEALRLALDSP